MATQSGKADRVETIAACTVWIVALLLAIIGARRTIGGWNDGGRLATVECLVDYGTLAIDQSVFVKLPATASQSKRPSRPAHPATQNYDTKDRILVGGKFYSHRPPVPGVVLAGFYYVWQKASGLNAREHCDQFCRWMTLAASGLAYLSSVAGIFHLAGALGLALRSRLLLAASFGTSTLALVYARNVNDHILLLAVGVAIACLLARLKQATQPRPAPAAVCAASGMLGGLGYTIDSAAGLLLCGATAAMLAYRSRGARPIAWFLLGALPWLAMHHALNYFIAGTLRPAALVPELFQWPGSPFADDNLTGLWQHSSLTSLAQYGLALLFGTRGFVWHNLPLLAVPLAIAQVWRRRPCWRADVVWAATCMAGTWLLYSALSNNYSGLCRSIRWFVPLLAPAYYLLALGLRVDRRLEGHLWVLSGFGCLATEFAWRQGPWSSGAIPYFWPLTAAAVACWLLVPSTPFHQRRLVHRMAPRTF